MDYSNTFTILIQVRYYSDIDEEEKEEFSLIYAKDMHEVADFVEAYYGKDAVQVTVTFLSDSVVHLTPETIDKLLKCDSWNLTI